MTHTRGACIDVTLQANRRSAEAKLLDVEDTSDQLVREKSDKISTLESVVRMLQVKEKNAADQRKFNIHK